MVELKAADLLVASHPLHKPFVASCKVRGVEPSKRQARKWLASHPHYKVVRKAA